AVGGDLAALVLDLHPGAGIPSGFHVERVAAGPAQGRIADQAAAFQQDLLGAGVDFAGEAVERATGLGGRQLGGGTQQAAAVRQRVERGGDGRLVRGAGGGGQGRAADHVHAEGARALQQRDRQERRQVRVVDR